MNWTQKVAAFAMGTMALVGGAGCGDATATTSPDDTASTTKPKDPLATGSSFAALTRDVSADIIGQRERALVASGANKAKVDSSSSFYLAISKKSMTQKWFLSTYITQFFPGAVSGGAARSMGTRIVSFEENLHRYGITVNLTKEIALYALDSTTFAPQGNSNTRDINGVLLPAQFGKGKEFGIKTALGGGRFSATLSFYDMSLTNVAVLQSGLSPVTGIGYFAPTGLQLQKGWDATISLAPNANWQLIATAYKGTVKDQNGVKLNNTYDSLYSFFTRYNFAEGSLKGFSIGGGASKTGGNSFVTQGASYIYPTGVTPAPIVLESVWNANMFVSYQYSKKWTFRLNIENVLDKAFALGAQTPLFADLSPPRTFQFSTSYKF